jgi:hypothetical protein
MALFGKKKGASGSGARVEPSPPSVGENDLILARQGLTRFEQDSIHHRDIKAAVLALAISAKSPDPVEATMIMSRTGEFAYGRLWTWLVAVADRAYDDGDYDLVAHITFFFFNWSVTPELQHLDVHDAQEMRVGGQPSNKIKEQIYSIAFDTLPLMDPETVLIETPSNVLTADELLHGCASDVIRIGCKDATLTEMAHSLLGR